MKKSIFLLLFCLLLLQTGCFNKKMTSTVTRDSTPTTVTAKAPPPLSAFFGLDHAIPQRGNLICRGAAKTNGMPVIFPLEVEMNTLQAGDFQVKTRSGKLWTPFCASALPATDPGEIRTILLLGEYGSEKDPPVLVTIVGNLHDKSGTRNFKGTSVKVTPLKAGPTIVLAEMAPAKEWKKKNRGATKCPAGTKRVLRVTWAGGVTRADKKPVGEHERKAYTLTMLGKDGKQKKVVPFGLADLNDNDNNHDLCLKTDGAVLSVSFKAGLLVDPRGDLNPATAMKIESVLRKGKAK